MPYCAMLVIDQPAMASGFARCWCTNRPNLLVNKTARIVWAVMMREEGYRAREVFEQPA